MNTSSDNSPILLAYSGGLDTSFCVPWLIETYGRPVITACVNTGGLNSEAAQSLHERSIALGASEHVLIEARDIFFQRVIKYLIAGNVRRGQFYPMCVGAERGIQATLLAELAKERGTATVAHGCTAAGNDQVRFEVALKTINPNLEIIAPVRDQSFVREEQVAYLQEGNYPMPPSGAEYSINRGLWGISIGGQETLTSLDTIPEHAWVLSSGAFDQQLEPRELKIGFEAGIPVSIDSVAMNPVDLIEKLEVISGGYGIGRGIHLGDTVLGTKGRVAFEAPAAEILLTAHRELEKLVLSSLQMTIKEGISLNYGNLVHEGKQLDPVCRDIEALLDSSQQRVSGEVKLKLRPGNLFVEGIDSDYSLMAATKGVYGEAAGEWTPRDALGYSTVLSLPGMLQTRAGQNK
jgi:argininosuccinate synthase